MKRRRPTSREAVVLARRPLCEACLPGCAIVADQTVPPSPAGNVPLFEIVAVCAPCARALKEA